MAALLRSEWYPWGLQNAKYSVYKPILEPHNEIAKYLLGHARLIMWACAEENRTHMAVTQKKWQDNEDNSLVTFLAIQSYSNATCGPGGNEEVGYNSPPFLLSSLIWTACRNDVNPLSLIKQWKYTLNACLLYQGDVSYPLHCGTRGRGEQVVWMANLWLASLPMS